MRNAALILGVIGASIGLVIGFFSFGYTELVGRYAELGELLGNFADPALIRAVSFAAPILGLAGAGMAKTRALWAAVLMGLSAGGMYFAFGFNVFTMFPIGMLGLAAIMAAAAGKPDEAQSHF